MSLTTKIKERSGIQYQASDGTVYILQKVDTTSIIVEQGGLADFLAVKDGDENFSMADLLKTDPRAAENLLKTGLMTTPKTLKAGLIGEVKQDGSLMIYEWTNKPAILLLEGELNVALIPTDLRDELLEQIRKLSEMPVKLEDTNRFPAV